MEELYYLYSKNKGADQCAVTAQLICAFVFAYAKIKFSHDAAQLSSVLLFFFSFFICSFFFLFMLRFKIPVNTLFVILG